MAIVLVYSHTDFVCAITHKVFIDNVGVDADVDMVLGGPLGFVFSLVKIQKHSKLSMLIA